MIESTALRLAIVSLALHACGDAQQTSRSAENLVPPESVLIGEYGISPERAQLLAVEANAYVRRIGGPQAYANVLLKIGARPSPASVQQYSGLLALRGAVRLGKPTIDSLATVRSRMFDRYAPSQCEFLVGAPQTEAGGWRFLASLDSTVLNALFGLYATTTLAEINESGSIPSFNRPRHVAAWKSFYAKLPTSEQDRFIRFLDAPAKSVEEECWFQRHFWTLLPELREEDARIIMWQIATNKFQPQR